MQEIYTHRDEEEAFTHATPRPESPGFADAGVVDLGFRYPGAGQPEVLRESISRFPLAKLPRLSVPAAAAKRRS